MKKFFIVILLNIAAIVVYSQEVIEKEYTSDEVLVSAGKVNYTLTDDMIPERVYQFETRHEKITENLKSFEKFISGSSKKLCLTSTGYLQQSVTENYRVVKSDAKKFCTDIQNEISKAQKYCECLSKTRLDYISVLQKMQISVSKQEQKVDDAVIKRLKGRV